MKEKEENKFLLDFLLRVREEFYPQQKVVGDYYPVYKDGILVPGWQFKKWIETLKNELLEGDEK